MKRQILSRIGFALLAVAYIGGVSVLGTQGTQPLRSFTSGKLGLYFGKTFVGYLVAAEGGDPRADVVRDNVGSDKFVKKHIGNPKYGEVMLMVPFGSLPAVNEWIASVLTGNNAKRDGTIAFADFQSNIKSLRQFTRGMITEIGFPECDGSSKDAAYLTLKFAPETTTHAKGQGVLPAPLAGAAPKQFSPANFKLEIEGLDCTRVSKIDAITIKQSVARDDIGELRDVNREPGKIDFPNLVLTVPEGSSETFTKWMDDFVIKGNSGEKFEKKGSLAFLSANRTEALANLNFTGLGIFKIEDARAERQVDKVRQLKIYLYCEKIDFVAPKPPR